MTHLICARPPFRFIVIIVAIIAAVASSSNGKAASPATGQPVTASAAAPQILQGKRFTVLVEGSGPDVVLIPGLASPRDVWSAAAEELKSNYRLHIVQIRGFGDDAGINADGPVLQPFVTELADYIDDEIINKGRPAPAIIGHSLGGLSALMLGAQIPDKIGKIMVVDAVPFIGTIFGQTSVDAIRPQADTMLVQMRAAYGKPVPQMPEMTEEQKAAVVAANSMSISAAGQQQVTSWSMTADQRVVAQAMYDDMTTDVRGDLPKISAPVTLLYAHDPAIMTEAIVTGVFVPQYAGTPTFSAVRIEGSRHFIMLDQQKRFVSEARIFLGEGE